MITKIYIETVGFIALWIFFPAFTIAGIIEVCKGCPVSSISTAIKTADEGNTIYVKKGLYQEYDIIIDKPITLKAEKGTVIDGKNKGEILLVKANNVTIDGFEIKNVGTSNLRDYAAIRIQNSTNFTVKNNTIFKPFFAIYLERSNDGIVENNKIYGQAKSEFGSGNGIQLWYSHRNTITNNEVHQMRDGIYLEFSDKNIIDGNISEKNVRYGLHFMFCNNNTVSNCIYKSNGAGIAIMFSKEMYAHNNIFIDNWGTTAYGMLLKEVYDAKLKYNLFKRNTIAINVEGSSRITYEHNDFQSNGWAVNSRGANYLNTFTKNNFLDNSFDISYNGSMNKNSFDGNYWSSYSGYDLNKDGIGDIPYRPIKLFSYIVNTTPEAIILLRSIFIDIVDFSEKVSPVFTPDNLIDALPSMKIIKHDNSK